MNFELTEDQREVQALARKIIEDYCSNEQLRAFDKGERFDEALWQELAKAGLLGIAIEEQYGGMGFDFETLCLLVEEVGRCVAPLPVVSSLVLATLMVQRFADADLKTKILPDVASGKSLLIAALSETDDGGVFPSTMQAIKTDSGWQLDGEKHFVPFASRAQMLLLSARTETGVALYLLPADSKGVSMQQHTSTAGENQYSLSLQSVELGPEQCLLSGEKAQTALIEINNLGVAASCAQMLGICDVMLRTTAAYTSEREQFGVKVATFQAVGQRAADSYIDVECLKLVTQKAIYAVEHESPKEALSACLVAKIWAGDAGHRVSHAAQHLHGGMGVDRDYSLWRYCLWAKQLELTLGNSAELTEQLGAEIASEFKMAVS
ncbi:MAG: acyl-CoA dehydrogenase family protein [Pseudomonadales bacterium]